MARFFGLGIIRVGTRKSNNSSSWVSDDGVTHKNSKETKLALKWLSTFKKRTKNTRAHAS
jgi:hypothetical protein